MTHHSFVVRLLLLTALCICTVTSLGSAHADDTQSQGWEPTRTGAFIVGVLEWKDSESFPSFRKDLRRDAELVEVLKRAGVPSQQIVYLQDKQATIGAGMGLGTPQSVFEGKPIDTTIARGSEHILA